jgi:hypothetical protein
MKPALAPLALAAALALGPAVAALWPTPVAAQISLRISIAPPLLPYYEQPSVPGDGYIWTPGYWGWSPGERDYYWVPGTWVLAPEPGDLWTPGYWAFETSGYFWHIGYWGRQVGFYGGVNYGHGYYGSGYQGGRWEGRTFRYNRAASNVNPRFVHNVYGAPAPERSGGRRISFNGGPAGVSARPSANERRWQEAPHTGPVPDQVQHERAAVQAPTQRATGPHGGPQVAATPRPSAFSAPEAEPVRSGPPGRGGNSRRDSMPTQLPPVQAAPPPRPSAPPGPPPSPPPSPPPRPETQRPERAGPQQQPDRAAPQRPERAEPPPRPERDEPRGRGEPQRQDTPRKER